MSSFDKMRSWSRWSTAPRKLEHACDIFHMEWLTGHTHRHQNIIVFVCKIDIFPTYSVFRLFDNCHNHQRHSWEKYHPIGLLWHVENVPCHAVTQRALRRAGPLPGLLRGSTSWFLSVMQTVWFVVPSTACGVGQLLSLGPPILAYRFFGPNPPPVYLCALIASAKQHRLTTESLVANWLVVPSPAV